MPKLKEPELMLMNRFPVQGTPDVFGMGFTAAGATNNGSNTATIAPPVNGMFDWGRMFATWGKCEAVAGKYDFMADAPNETYLRAKWMRDNGLKILMNVTPQDWPGTPYTGLNWGGPSGPAGETAWHNLIYAMLQQFYDMGLRRFELGNEPDGAAHYSGLLNRKWETPLEQRAAACDFARWARITQEAIDQFCDACGILSADRPRVWGVGVEGLQLAQGGGAVWIYGSEQYLAKVGVANAGPSLFEANDGRGGVGGLWFDGITYHGYEAGPWPNLPAFLVSYWQLFDHLAELRAPYALPSTVAITEVNIMRDSSHTAWKENLTDTERAQFILTLYGMNAARGAPLFFYCYDAVDFGLYGAWPNVAPAGGIEYIRNRIFDLKRHIFGKWIYALGLRANGIYSLLAGYGPHTASWFDLA